MQIDVKEIVFDYFNIITKEYEMAYERWRSDKDYQEAIASIKEQVDSDFIDKKWDDIPQGLTKEKTRELVKKKQETVNNLLMSMIQGQ